MSAMLCTGVIAGLGVTTAGATTYTWNGADTNVMLDGTKWLGTPATVDNDGTADLIFTSATAGSGGSAYINGGTNFSIHSVTFNSNRTQDEVNFGRGSSTGASWTMGATGTGAYIQNDASFATTFSATNNTGLSLAGDVEVRGSGGASSTLTLAVGITGSGNLTFKDANAFTTVLSRQASYTGTVVINGGVVQNNSIGSLTTINGGTLQSTAITTGAGTITMNGGALVLSSTVAANTTVNIAATGNNWATINNAVNPSIILKGTGNLVKLGAGNIQYAAGTDFAGNLDIGGGTFGGGGLASSAGGLNIHVRDTGAFVLATSSTGETTFTGLLTGTSSTANNTDGVFKTNGSDQNSGAFNYYNFGSGGVVSPGGMASNNTNTPVVAAELPHEAAVLKITSDRNSLRSGKFLSGSTLRTDITGPTDTDADRDQMQFLNVNASASSTSGLTFDPGAKFDFFLFTPGSDLTQSWRIAAADQLNGLTASTALASDVSNPNGYVFTFKDLNDNPITTFGGTSGWTSWSLSTERDGTNTDAGVDYLVLTATYVAVPEPAGLGLLGAAAFGLLRSRRRHAS